MASSIAPLVRDCMKAFKRLSCSEHVEGVPREALEEEFGRFRIWAGNVSAHTTGRRSLEYRLRDSSELATAVVGYLQRLLDTLAEVVPVDEPSSSFGAESASDLDESDAELFAGECLGDDVDQSVLMEDIAMIISSLLRISSALRNPARKDQVRYAEDVNTRYYEPYDIDHVRGKFPELSENLIMRLGKTISRHRQFFKYQDEHHKKMSAGLDDFDEVQTVQGPSTIATSLHQHPHDPLLSIDDVESVHTATSYALTEFGDTALAPPPWPESARNGELFECPLCFYVISTVDERAWKQHVYEDIPPFVCTHDNCDAITRQFARRRDWLHHMREHAKSWTCPKGCSISLTSPKALESHIRWVHPDVLANMPLSALLVSCESEDLAQRSTECPLCHEMKPSVVQLHKHIGRHLEQLALFAVPQHLLGAAQDDLSDRDSVEDEPDAPALRDSDDESGPVLSNALGYLDRVKVQFADRPEIYDRFLDIMNGYKTGALNTASVIDRVGTLFAGFPDLIQDFSTYLPAGYVVEPPTEEDLEGTHVTTTSGAKIPATSTAAEQSATKDENPQAILPLPRSPITPADKLYSAPRYLDSTKDAFDEFIKPDAYQAPLYQTVVPSISRPPADQESLGIDPSPASRINYGKVYAVETNIKRQYDFEDDAGETLPPQKDSNDGTPPGYHRDEIYLVPGEGTQRSRSNVLSFTTPDGTKPAGDDVAELRMSRLEHDQIEADIPTADLKTINDAYSTDENEVVCPLRNRDSSACRKRCFGEKRYRSMQEHIRRAHPEYYISKLPATRQSFELMVSTLPHERRTVVPDPGDVADGLPHLPPVGFSPSGSNPSDMGVIDEQTTREAHDSSKDDPQLKERLRRAVQDMEEGDEAWEIEPSGIKSTREGRKANEMRAQPQGTNEVMLDEERAKGFADKTRSQLSKPVEEWSAPPGAPVYPKIHKDYIELRTLEYYKLPWTYDKNDPDYIIIQRDMDKQHTNLLFEHTARMRKNFPALLKAPTQKEQQPAAPSSVAGSEESPKGPGKGHNSDGPAVSDSSAADSSYPSAEPIRPGFNTQQVMYLGEHGPSSATVPVYAAPTGRTDRGREPIQQEQKSAGPLAVSPSRERAPVKSIHVPMSSTGTSYTFKPRIGDLKVVVQEDNGWVSTDFAPHTSVRDITAYLEALWPSTVDSKDKTKLQHYKITRLANGTHRIWAQRRLRADEVHDLENQSDLRVINSQFDDDVDWDAVD